MNVLNWPKLTVIAGASVSPGSESGDPAYVLRPARDAPGGGKSMRDLSGAKHSATKAVWAGEERYLLEGATQVPIVQSIPFGYDDLDEWMSVALGRRKGHIYSRNTNPPHEPSRRRFVIWRGRRTRRASPRGWQLSPIPFTPS